MISHISYFLGQQTFDLGLTPDFISVQSSGLCLWRTALQIDRLVTAGGKPAPWEWLPRSKGNDFKEKHELLLNKHKNRVELFFYFIFTGFGHQRDVV